MRSVDEGHVVTSTNRPPKQVVLLGASNLAHDFPLLVDLFRSCHDGPMDFLTAHGHGRSFGVLTSVLGRRLCGICECGLWSRLDSQHETPMEAVITDVGNDLFYEHEPERIVSWVHECLTRLLIAKARVVMTGLPLCNVPKLSETRFRLVRSCVYPGCRLSMNSLIARAQRLDELLHALANDHGIPYVEPQSSWYGWDPLHPRWSLRATLWREVLSRGHKFEGGDFKRTGSIWRTMILRSRCPEERVLWGWTQRAVQPCAHLKDGTTISIF